jgi:hypothetical protein
MLNVSISIRDLTGKLHDILHRHHKNFILIIILY